MKKAICRSLILLMLLCTCFVFLRSNAYAQTLTGSCGNSGKTLWAFDTDTGKFIISIKNGGTSWITEFANSSYAEQRPWVLAGVKPADIKSAVIASGITNIASYMFENCTNLSTVSVPSTVSKIGVGAFDNSGITSFTVNSGVTALNAYTFRNCKKLKSVTFKGSSIRVISGSVFENCTSLTSIKLPAETDAIYNSAFKGCTNLKTVVMPTIAKKYTISDGSTMDPHIDNYAFYGCKSLESMTLPKGIESINGYAFAGCTSMKWIKIPDKNARIPWTAAFENCRKGMFIITPADSLAYTLINVNEITSRYRVVKMKDISKDPLQMAAVWKISDQTYTGSAIKPSPTVKIDDYKLQAGTDYTLSWQNNTNVGKATVVLTGKGCCAGKTISRNFTILPKGTGISALSAAKNSVKVTWIKQPKQIDGYQIQYSPDKTFATNRKIVTVAGASKTAGAVKSLTSGKTYYFRVRTYKSVDGVKYLAKWSAAKSIKTKK